AIAYVTSGGHLLELAADTDPPASAGLLALGGLTYGDLPPGPTQTRDDRGLVLLRGDANERSAFAPPLWRPLPGTRREAERISQSYHQTFPRTPAPTLLTGMDGDAPRLKRALTPTGAAPRYRYLH